MDQTASPEHWYQNRLGIAVVALYVIFAVLAAAVTTPPVLSVLGVTPTAMPTVPVYVYLFSLLGALAYVFTAILNDVHQSTNSVIEVGLRLPAAWMLAAGMYLLAGMFLPDRGSAVVPPVQIIAGLAFLVGLYIDLTLRVFAAVAEMIYQRIEIAKTRGDASEETQ
jgi:hypothetical protein